MYERILVPLDGSEAAEAALAYAELLPSRHVRLLAVEHERIDLTAVCRATRDCQTYLDRAAEPLRQRGRHVETFVVYGNPAAQILAFAETADLVVMGSRGHGAVERFMLGSVADQVARHASVPTLIVWQGPGTRTAARIVRIVVPLDGSPLAEQALPVVATLASDLDVPIHLVQVLDFDPVRAAVRAGIPAAAASMRSQDAARGLAEQYLDERAEAMRKQGRTTTFQVLLGNPVAALLTTIQPDDLVVMTTHGLGGIRRWVLGSVAEQLVRAAEAPVLLVRTTAQDQLHSGVAKGSSVGSTS